MPQTKPTLTRRRVRFSLRTLLIVVLLLSLPLGWFALKMREAERQRVALDEIRKAGGAVYYDTQLQWESETRAGAWLSWFVEDAFSEFVVSFSGTQATDAELEHLNRLERLRLLTLSGTQITDTGLEHLSGLTNLDTLHVSNTQITDNGLERLKGLKELQWLHLSDTQITDVGLEHLSGLRRLRVLGVANTEVTDNGLKHLKGLTKLEWLNVSDTQVTDEGIDELQKALPNCRIYVRKKRGRKAAMGS